MAVENEAGAAAGGVWTGADISSFLPLTEMVSPVETFLTVRDRLDPLEESEDNSPGDLDLFLDQWQGVTNPFEGKLIFYKSFTFWKLKSASFY